MAGVLDQGFSQSHRHCGENFAKNDRAYSLRSFTLAALDGTLTPHGLISLLPEGEVQPIRTTWVDIPTPRGSEQVMVNCVEAISGNRLRLTNGDAKSTPDFMAQPGLWDDPAILDDFLLGLEWGIVNNRREKGEPIRIRVRASIFGGHLDRKHHVFHIADNRLLLSGEYGGENGGSPVILPSAGPIPNVSRS